MKFRLVVFCVLFFGNSLIVETRESEDFSYYAIVDANWIECGGILITDRYVITPAFCVEEIILKGGLSQSVSASVFLVPGWRKQILNSRLALIEQPPPAPRSPVTVRVSFVDVLLDFDNFYLISSKKQVIRSQRVFVHEDYKRYSDDYQLNNIALVKLSKPAILGNNVQPGKLIFEQDSGRFEKKYANISGYIELSNNVYANYAAAQIKNKDTCKHIYANNSEEIQQFCIQMLTPVVNSLHGNVISVGNKIIGFTPNPCSCLLKPKDCSSTCLVLNVQPFLEWMSRKMNIPIKEFTSQESNDYHILSKMESFITDFNQTIQERLNELQTKIEEIQIKEDRHFIQLQEGITNILKKMDNKSEGEL